MVFSILKIWLFSETRNWNTFLFKNFFLPFMEAKTWFNKNTLTKELNKSKYHLMNLYVVYFL